MKIPTYLLILVILFSCTANKSSDKKLFTFNNIELLMSRKTFFSIYDSLSREDTSYKVINHYSFEYVAEYFSLNGNQCVMSILPKFRNNILAEIEVSFFPEQQALPF